MLKKCGRANITISLKSNPKIKKVVKVTVGKPVTRVKVNKSALTIKKGRVSSDKGDSRTKHS